MTIETRTFDRATLHTDCGASLFAMKAEEYGRFYFYVAAVAERGQPKCGRGFYFSAEDCREAAAFFEGLAEEIEASEAAAKAEAEEDEEDGWF